MQIVEIAVQHHEDIERAGIILLRRDIVVAAHHEKLTLRLTSSSSEQYLHGLVKVSYRSKRLLKEVPYHNDILLRSLIETRFEIIEQSFLPLATTGERDIVQELACNVRVSD